MADNDYYKVLGVSRDASQDEIRRAYRKLAKENHPDVKKDDAAAAQLFQKVQDAYSVLSDPEKRIQYDRFGVNFAQAGRGGPGGAGPTGGWTSAGPAGGFDFQDLFGGGFEFDEILGGGRSRKNGGRASRGQNIEAEVQIAFETAARGGSVDLQLETGGKVQTLTVKIPVGVDSGSVVRLAGQGHPGRGSGPAGDLLLTVQVNPHPLFRREGANLLVDVPITPSEAILGGKVEVPTLSEGTVMLTIPPGTSSGMKLRLKGKGVADAQSKQTGDQFVVIKIVVPKRPDEALQALYQQVAQHETSPRTGLW